MSNAGHIGLFCIVPKSMRMLKYAEEWLAKD